jgi:hypothetical protein
MSADTTNWRPPVAAEEYFRLGELYDRRFGNFDDIESDYFLHQAPEPFLSMLRKALETGVIVTRADLARAYGTDALWEEVVDQPEDGEPAAGTRRREKADDRH